MAQKAKVLSRVFLRIPHRDYEQLLPEVRAQICGCNDRMKVRLVFYLISPGRWIILWQRCEGIRPESGDSWAPIRRCRSTASG